MKCSLCQQDKPEEDFAFRNSARGIRQKRCRLCVKAYSSDHYQRNKSVYIARGYRQSRIVRKELHRKFIMYLSLHPCVDCGESDPIVLEFDHRDENTKLMSINKMRTMRYSWNTILAEIEKCDVRCANCHRRRTARQYGWERFYLDVLNEAD